jgi:hypothetical protein
MTWILTQKWNLREDYQAWFDFSQETDMNFLNYRVVESNQPLGLIFLMLWNGLPLLLPSTGDKLEFRKIKKKKKKR